MRIVAAIVTAVCCTLAGYAGTTALRGGDSLDPTAAPARAGEVPSAARKVRHHAWERAAGRPAPAATATATAPAPVAQPVVAQTASAPAPKPEKKAKPKHGRKAAERAPEAVGDEPQESGEDGALADRTGGSVVIVEED
ncbi:MAG: hypothetical protein HZB46_00465 [Solirubrobacterales bacterium]|nr:hypothetical protein [Solirubrobacterales bacterium]